MSATFLPYVHFLFIQLKPKHWGEMSGGEMSRGELTKGQNIHKSPVNALQKSTACVKGSCKGVPIRVFRCQKYVDLIM